MVGSAATWLVIDHAGTGHVVRYLPADRAVEGPREDVILEYEWNGKVRRPSDRPRICGTPPNVPVTVEAGGSVYKFDANEPNCRSHPVQVIGNIGPGGELQWDREPGVTAFSIMWTMSGVDDFPTSTTRKVDACPEYRVEAGRSYVLELETRFTADKCIIRPVD
jgi:hypothetical protein